MIQRKQSIWLLLAAVFSACVFLFDIYTAHTLINGVDTVTHIRVSERYPLVLIALVMTILPLINIFMFKDRKRQMRMAAVNIIVVGAFISAMLAYVNMLSKQEPVPTSGSYWIGAIMPMLSLVFLVLAISGIRKDEKLVRSVDRLR